MLDLRRHPAGLRSRHWREALPWLIAGALPAMLLLGTGVLALPDAAEWQDRWLAHEFERKQRESAQELVRAEQAHQAIAARHALQWQAWQTHENWLAQLWQGLSQLPAGVYLQRLQMDGTRVQLQLSAAQEASLTAILHDMQAAGTGPWQLRQQTFVEALARSVLSPVGGGSDAGGRWLFVLQADVPVSETLSVSPQAVASVPSEDQGPALVRASPVRSATTVGVP